MDYNQVYNLLGAEFAPPAEPIPEADGLLGRVGKNLGNAIPKGIGHVLDLFQTDEAIAAIKGEPVKPTAERLAPFDISPAEGLGDKAIDVVAGELPSYLIPYTGAAKLVGGAARGLKIAGRIVPALEMAAGNAAVDAALPGHDAGSVAAAGGVGAVEGFTSMLPRSARLPAIAGASLLYGAYTANRPGHTWQEGVIAGGTNLLGGMMFGASKADDLATLQVANRHKFEIDPRNDDLFPTSVPWVERAPITSVPSGMPRSAFTSAVRESAPYRFPEVEIPKRPSEQPAQILDEHIFPEVSLNLSGRLRNVMERAVRNQTMTPEQRSAAALLERIGPRIGTIDEPLEDSAGRLVRSINWEDPIIAGTSYSPRSPQKQSAVRRMLDAEATRSSAEPKVEVSNTGAAPEGTGAAPAVATLQGRRVSITDSRGGVSYGFETSPGQVRFDGESKTVQVPEHQIAQSDAPLSLKEKQKRIGRHLETLDAEILQMRTAQDAAEANPNHVTLDQLKEGPQGPTPKTGSLVDEDLGRQYEHPKRPGDPKAAPEKIGPKIADAYTDLPDEVKRQVHQMVEAVLHASNPHVRDRISWSSARATSGYRASTDMIELTMDNEVLATLQNWRTASAKSREMAVMRIANVTGHEIGHMALSHIETTNPKLFRRMLREFDSIPPEVRYQLVKSAMENIGLYGHYTPHELNYLAGERGTIAQEYAFHTGNTKSLDRYGIHEFFATLYSGHVNGTLDESLLPTTIQKVWRAIRNAFTRSVEFVKSVLKIESKSSDLEAAVGAHMSMESVENFHQMLNQVWSEFRAMDDMAMYRNREAVAIKEALELSEGAARDRKLRAKDNEPVSLRLEEDDLTYIDNYVKSLNDVKKMIPLRRLVAGNISKELMRSIAQTVAGALAGGTLPTITDDKISLAEGMLMGAVLGAAGPSIIKRMFASVPGTSSKGYPHRSATQALKELFTRGNFRDIAGEAANGHASAPAHFIRWVERNFRLHLPPNVADAIIHAQSEAAWALQIVHDALEKTHNLKVPATLQTEAREFLTGKRPEHLWRASHSSNPEATRYVELMVTAKDAQKQLQQMLADGLPDGPLKGKILQSIRDGDYLTNAYKLFVDPQHRPTLSQIEAAASRMATDSGLDLATSRALVEDYVHRKKTASGTLGGSALDIQHKVEGYIFKKRKTLPDEFVDLLGPIEDPKLAIVASIQHLYSSAIASRFIDTAASLVDDVGLPMSMSLKEHSSRIENLRAKASPTNLEKQQLATLQSYVPIEAGNVRLGKLAGTMASRFIRDHVATFDTPWGILDGTVMRHIAKFHNAIKIGRTALNPITIVRNIMAVPILSAISGAGPAGWKAAYKIMRNKDNPAFKGMWEEMLREGIWGVDQVRGEFFRGADEMLLGSFDTNTVVGLAKYGVHRALDFYRKPDMIVRGATYLAAKARFAKELGLPETAREVIDAARHWTNRYTIDYANVSPMVKTLRQLPFVNLFISFTSEITRITKNLIEDAMTDAKLRPRALTLLAGLTAVPMGMQAFAERQFAPAEQREWDKYKRALPDYARNKVLIPFSRTKEGHFKYLDITPLLQVDALMTPMTAVAKGDLKGALATNPVIGWENTPMFNIAREWSTGRDAHSGRRVEGFSGYTRSFLKETVPPTLPFGYEWNRISDAMAKTDKGERGITNQYTGKRVTPGDIVFNYLTGVRVGQGNLQSLTAKKISETRRAIADEQAYLRDILSTDLPQQVKDKAVVKFVRAKAQILEKLKHDLE